MTQKNLESEFQKTISQFKKYGSKIDHVYDLFIRGTGVSGADKIEKGWSDLDLSIVVEEVNMDVLQQINHMYKKIKKGFPEKLSLTIVSRKDLMCERHHHGIKPVYYSHRLKNTSLLKKDPAPASLISLKELRLNTLSNIAYLIHELRARQLTLDFSNKDEVYEFSKHAVKRGQHLVRNCIFVLTSTLSDEIEEKEFHQCFPWVGKKFLDHLETVKHHYSHEKKNLGLMKEYLREIINGCETIYEGTVVKADSYFKEEAFFFPERFRYKKQIASRKFVNHREKIKSICGVVLAMFISNEGLAMDSKNRKEDVEDKEQKRKAPTISRITTFEKVHQAIETSPKGTLLLVDLDGVVLEFLDSVFRPCAKHVKAEQQRVLMEKCETAGGDKVQAKDLYKDLKCKMIDATLTHKRTRLLDPLFLKIVERARQKGIIAVGLTSGKTGEYGIFPDISECRLQQVTEAGVDFSSFTSHIKPLFETSGDGGGAVSFRGGIIFADNVKKSQAVDWFLRMSGTNPPKILMVDDREAWLADVSDWALVNKKDFLGFHMEHQNFEPEKPDEALIKFQYEYLFTKKQWLTDSQARKIMAKI